ncbi:hypothetical protein ACL02O_04935 [Micromonospora sp. MS34]|uniref:hypothetical protein n=1 Tax=Micromonospora sp. MS34 TaxID=3385971 RepID=UPI0039A0A8F6
MPLLLTQLDEIFGDWQYATAGAFELGVDHQQVRLGIPPRMVERPAIPDCVDVEDLPLAREAHPGHADRPLRVGIPAHPGEDVTGSGGEEEVS